MRTITIPIVEDAASHAAALSRIDALWGSPKGSEARAEMDALVLLVSAYEESSDPWADLSPLEVVRDVMGSRGLSQADLAPVFGSPSQVSDFLSGRRAITKTQALRMRDAYNVPLDMLLSTAVTNLP